MLLSECFNDLMTFYNLSDFELYQPVTLERKEKQIIHICKSNLISDNYTIQLRDSHRKWHFNQGQQCMKWQDSTLIVTILLVDHLCLQLWLCYHDSYRILPQVRLRLAHLCGRPSRLCQSCVSLKPATQVGQSKLALANLGWSTAAYTEYHYNSLGHLSSRVKFQSK